MGCSELGFDQFQNIIASAKMKKVDYESMPFRFDNSKITNDMLLGLLMENGQETALSKIYEITQSKWINKKINSIKNIPVDMKDNAIVDMAIDDKGKLDVSKLKNYSIAMYELMQSVKETYHIAMNQNLTPEEHNKIFDSNGNPQLKSFGLAVTIGKKAMLSSGYAFNSSEYKSDMALYHMVGQNILEDLVKGGILDANSDGDIVNNNYKDPKTNKKVNGDSKNLIKGLTYKLNFKTTGSQRITYPVMTKTDSRNPVKEILDFYSKGGEKRMSQDMKNHPMVAAFDLSKVFNTLLTPSNLKMPTAKSSYDKKLNAFSHLAKNSNTDEDTVATTAHKKMNRVKMRIKPSMKSLLNAMSALYFNSEDGSLKETANMNKDSDYNLLHEIFGETKSPFDFQYDSMVGRTRTKTQGIISLFETIDKLPEQFNFNYFVTRNGRKSIYETVLAFQGDKFFSRNIITTSDGKNNSYSVDSDEYHHFIEAISDETGVDDIRTFMKDNKEMSELLDTYDLLFKTDKETDETSEAYNNARVEFLKKVVEDGYQFKALSVWDYLSKLEAMSDYRSSLETGSLDTDWQSSPDSSASGVTLLLMELLGKFDPDDKQEVEKLFVSMGYLPDADGSYKRDIRDVYQILENTFNPDGTVKEDIDPELAKVLSIKSKDTSKGIEGIQEFIALGVISPRDISKPFTMTQGSYGQGKKSSSEVGSRDMVDKFYDNLNSKDKKVRDNIIKYIEKILPKDHPYFEAKKNKGDKDSYTTERMYIEENSYEINKYLIPHIEKNVTQPLADLMQKHFVDKYMKKHREVVKTIFNDIKKIKGNKPIKVLPPQTWMELSDDIKNDPIELAKYIKKHGMELEKTFEVFQELTDPETGNPIQDVVSERSDNLVSAYVIPQHSKDDQVYNQAVASTDDFKGMSLFDANYGTIGTNTQFIPQYNEAQIKVAKEYDFVEQLINTLEAYGGNEVDIEAYRAINNTDKKIEILDKMDASNPDMKLFFGYPKLERTAKPKETQQKPEVKPESTKETKEDVSPKEDIKEESKGIVDTSTPFDEPTSKSEDSVKEDKVQKKLQLLVNTSKNPILKFMRDKGIKANTVIDLNQKSSYDYGLNKILIGSDFNEENAEKVLAHEVGHLLSVHYIMNNLNDPNVQYIRKTIQDLGDLNSLSNIPIQFQKIINDYKTGTIDDTIAIAEFVAMTGEDIEGTAKWLNDMTPTNKFRKFIQIVKNLISKFTNQPLTDFDSFYTKLDANVFTKSVINTMVLGQEYNQNNPDGRFSMKLEYQGDTSKASAIGSSIYDGTNKYIADVLILGETYSGGLIKNLYTLTGQVSPTMNKAFEAIEGSSMVQSTLHYMDLSKFNDKDFKNELLTQSTNAKNERQITYREAKSELNKAYIKLDSKQQKIVDEISSYGLLATNLTNASKNPSKINLASKAKIDSIIKTKGQGIDGNYMSQFPKLYNSIATRLLELHPEYKEVLDSDYMKIMTKYNHTQIAMINEGNFDDVSATGLKTIYKVPKQFKAINRKYLTPTMQSKMIDEGWYEARNGKDEFIIMAKDIKESVYVEGVIAKPRLDGGIQYGDKKIYLTEEEEIKLGKLDGRSTHAHAMSDFIYAQQAYQINNKIIDNNKIAGVLDKDQADNVVSMINDQDIEHPYMLNIEMDYNKIPKEILKHYKSIESSTETGANFVRKDVESWVTGYKNVQMVKNSPALKRIVYTHKKIVQLFKLHIITHNPVKIGMDLISNYTYLTAVGVPLIKQLKYSNQVAKDLKAMKQAHTNDVVKKLLGTYGKSKSDIDKLPLSVMYNNGFIQSNATEVMERDRDTVQGLQTDMDNIFKKLMGEDSQNRTKLAKVIMTGSKFGLGAETIIGLIARMGYGVKKDNTISNILSDISSELKEIKDNDDAVKYVQQFVGSPQSILTRLGSAAQTVADTIPRTVLFMHLKDQGKSDKEATNIAIEGFLDYRVEYPKEIKAMSDLGLILFPSFFLRISKVAYKLGVEKPLALATYLFMRDELGWKNEAIFGGTIIDRMMRDNVISDPTRAYDLNNLYPHELL